MKLHDLKPTPGSKKKKIRAARGISGKRGKTAGRGTKGQGARSGGGKGPYFEGGQLPLVRRLPFKRGFNNPFKIRYQEVNVWLLDRTFDDGDHITPVTLEAAGLVRESKNPIAILGDGALSKKLTVQANRFTGSAKTKIEQQGGTVEELPLRLTGLSARVRKLPKQEELRRYPPLSE
jgi:large subunit ribosomal protein L15